MKDARLAGGIVPPFTIALVAGERGQPTGEVGHVVGTVEVAPGAPSSVLARKK